MAKRARSDLVPVTPTRAQIEALRAMAESGERPPRRKPKPRKDKVVKKGPRAGRPTTPAARPFKNRDGEAACADYEAWIANATEAVFRSAVNEARRAKKP